MVKRVYFMENSDRANTAVDLLEAAIPCFVFRTPIEMDWLEVKIQARVEDLATVERILAEVI